MLAAAPDPRTCAIYYFLTAVFVLLVAFDTFFALPMLVSPELPLISTVSQVMQKLLTVVMVCTVMAHVYCGFVVVFSCLEKKSAICH